MSIYQDKPSLKFLFGGEKIYTNPFSDSSADDVHEASGVGHLQGGHSGRYPWGSGKEPYQHASDFLSRVNELKKEGLTETEICKAMGFVDKFGNAQSTKLRTQKSLAKSEIDMAAAARARKMLDSGMSLRAVAKEMGYTSESSVRSLLNSKKIINKTNPETVASELKEIVEKKGKIDVSIGVEKEFNLSREKFEQALYILEREDYPAYDIKIDQLTNPGQKTTIKVLCPPGTSYDSAYKGRFEVDSARDYVKTENIDILKKFKYPESMDSSRLKIIYPKNGGAEKDGLIEIRRGVKDLSLGDSHYAQVRILVDETHYLKGMAVYGNDKDFPDGIDILFNTSKKDGTPALGDDKNNTVLKKITNDPDNPFGSAIKEEGGQSYYDDPNGKYTDPITGKKQSLSLINKRSDQSDWSEWTDSVPSQFLAKQPMKLINRQLNLAKVDKQNDYEEILNLTNPTIKKIRLKKFADECDSAAVELKAAALPGQKYYVILPVPSIPENEVYAPRYKDGEKLALVRYPHGGTFEIPIVTVNNTRLSTKNSEIVKRIMGSDAGDAIAISSKVAARLSGADFDGDTVMAIPTGKAVDIMSTPELKGLKEYKYPDGHIAPFDPHEAYPPVIDENGKTISVVMPKGMIQREMGQITNLITDMTLKGAGWDEIAAATRHSMVVIDANKHQLNYKKSEIDNNIDILKQKYQKSIDENGNEHYKASTLISRAKNQTTITKRKGTPRTDPETGKLIFKEVDGSKKSDYKVKYVGTDPETGKKIYEPETKKVVDKNTGEVRYEPVLRTQKSNQMSDTDDARTLISDFNTEQEIAYANYANFLKGLANTARKEELSTPSMKYSAAANKMYANEVESLNNKLNASLMNAPRERKAQILANSEMKAKKLDNPDMTKKEEGKLNQIALTKARAIVGAKRTPVVVTDREWEAIQAGAISSNKLEKMINNMNADDFIKRSTPRQTKELSTTKINKIQAMKESGYTIAQISEAIGVSTSTVSNYLK